MFEAALLLLCRLFAQLIISVKADWNITSPIVMQINAKDKHVMFHGQNVIHVKEEVGNVTIPYTCTYCRYAKFHNEGNEFRDDIKLMFKNSIKYIARHKERLLRKGNKMILN